MYVLSLFFNTDSDEADITSLGRTFHTFALQQQEKHDLGLLTDGRLERQAVQWRWT